MVCGENFPNTLQDPKNTLFRELYRRTLRYLLDRSKAIDGKTNLVAPEQGASTVMAWDRPQRIGALRYELPQFIDFANPQWHRKPAPYAHYVIEGSLDGERWVPLADRRRGPWRGMKTDIFSPVEMRYVRFSGT